MTTEIAKPAADEHKPTLLQRINNVRREVEYIRKDKDVSTGAGSYKAVTHDAVVGQIRAALIKEGVIILQSLISSTANPYEVDADMKRAKQYRYEGRYEIRFVNADDADDNFTLVVESHAMDNADKAPGKAMSYAKKYAILKTFDIETGENEESRYTTFEAAEYLDAMAECETLEDLAKAYESALAAAKKADDAGAGREIIAMKNTMKKKIDSKGVK